MVVGLFRLALQRGRGGMRAAHRPVRLRHGCLELLLLALRRSGIRHSSHGSEEGECCYPSTLLAINQYSLYMQTLERDPNALSAENLSNLTEVWLCGSNKQLITSLPVCVLCVGWPAILVRWAGVPGACGACSPHAWAGRGVGKRWQRYYSLKFSDLLTRIAVRCIDFDGLAYNIVLAAKGSTSRLAELIISKFQGSFPKHRTVAAACAFTVLPRQDFVIPQSTRED